MENYSIYLKKFKVAIAIGAAGILLMILLMSRIIPAVQNIFKIQHEYKTQTAALADAERKLENLKAEEKARLSEESNMPKAIFKPITEGLDTESAISDEFGEILQLVRENKIKTRSIQYEYDPQDDRFIMNAANQYHVCRITAEVIGTYSQYENFLRDLFKHEHFLELSTIEITPYQKNKRILLIKMAIKLYAQRDPSSVVDMPQPTKSAAPQADAPQAKPANTSSSSPEKPFSPDRKALPKINLSEPLPDGI